MAPAAPVTATEMGDLLIFQSLKDAPCFQSGKRKLAQLFPPPIRNRNPNLESLRNLINHFLKRISVNRFIKLGGGMR